MTEKKDTVVRFKKKKPAFPPKKTDIVTFEFTEEELVAGLSDPHWRLSNLYTIYNKKKQPVIFRPNLIQQELLRGMWYRNLILKARQGGVSTFVQLFMLDTCLFSEQERAKVICSDLNLAEGILRDVFRRAYDNLPEPFKIALPTSGEPSKSKIEFSNGSIVEVTTSARGQTPSLVHLSEYGKIAAKDPQKAREIQTGTLTAAAEDALVFVESTAEGASGAFYDLVQTAANLKESGADLWKLDFKLFFFPWFIDPSYVAPPDCVTVSEKDHEYFNMVEQRCSTKISPEQRAWYVKLRDMNYAGDREMMAQEMPSFWEEPFQQSLEGAYFTEQFTRMRKENRITEVPYDPHYPVNLFFDLGANDETAIWFIQAKRGQFAVIDFLEDNGEPLSYFANKVDEKGYTLGFVYLPHDANHRRQGQDRNLTPEEMLQELCPHWRFQLVPRTPDKLTAIQQTRNFLPLCVFDEAKCKEGLTHLQSYRKMWDARKGMWKSNPNHDQHSNAADAFLQAGQAKAMNIFGYGNAGSATQTHFESAFAVEPDLGY